MSSGKITNGQHLEVVCDPPDYGSIIGSLRQEVFAVSFDEDLTIYRSTWVPYKCKTPHEWVTLWEMRNMKHKPCSRLECDTVYACGVADDHIWILISLLTGPRLYILDPWRGTVQTVKVQVKSGKGADVCSMCLLSYLLPVQSGFLVMPTVMADIDAPATPLARLFFRDGIAFLEELEGFGPLPENYLTIDTNIGVVSDSNQLVMWAGGDKFRLNDLEQPVVRVRATDDTTLTDADRVIFLRRNGLQCLVSFPYAVCCFDVSIEDSEEGVWEAVLRPCGVFPSNHMELLWAMEDGLLYRNGDADCEFIVRQRWPTTPSLFDAAFSALDQKVQEKLRPVEMKLSSNALQLVPFQTTIMQHLTKQLKTTDSRSSSNNN